MVVTTSRERSQSLKSPEARSEEIRRSRVSSTTPAASAKKKYYTRTVTAPPGKLGIVVDTAPEGPVVHVVKESSPLVGKVFEGDIIIGIGDEDTRAMSASAITGLMVKTANQTR